MFEISCVIFEGKTDIGAKANILKDPISDKNCSSPNVWLPYS